MADIPDDGWLDNVARQRRERVQQIEAMVVEAMDDTWADYVMDTGNYPDDFTVSGRHLHFREGRWAHMVGQAVAARLASIGDTPAPQSTEGGEVPALPKTQGGVMVRKQSLGPGWKVTVLYATEADAMTAAAALKWPGTLPCGVAPSAEAQAGQLSSRLHAAIVEALEHHHMRHTVEDEESALPLVDMLTPRGDTDIARGKEELELLADAIWNEVDGAALEWLRTRGVEASSEPDSYDAIWNALQRIDTAAAMLPTYAVKHEGGIEAFTQNIVDAITALGVKGPDHG